MAISGYQHTQAPPLVPTNQTDPIDQSQAHQRILKVQAMTNRTLICWALPMHINCAQPIEGTNTISHPLMQYMEPISTAISMQISKKIKKKIWCNQIFDIPILLLGNYSENMNNNNFSLHVKDKSQISLVPNQSIKKIFTTQSWTSAFLRFRKISH